MTIVAGTGHRPNKLPGGYSEIAFAKLVAFIEDMLLSAKATKVISGMALGFDQALAQAALNLKIPLVAAVPFKGMWTRWPRPSVTRFESLMNQATEIVIVSETNDTAAYQQRNEYMVDHCEVLLAMWDGSAGGTGNCMKYAQAKKTTVINLWSAYTSTWEIA